MKRILFCAAVVALAAACTNEDDLVMNQDNSHAKGLTFDVTLAEGATTRGEISKDENGRYPFFWYAEADRINVHAINVVANALNTNGKGVATIAGGAWTLSTNGASAYKATVSSGTGLFTAANDTDWLELITYDETKADETTATIVATYGDIKVASVTSEIKDAKVVPGELETLVVKTGTAGNASQTVARANASVAPMYSVSTGVKKESYNSLAEMTKLKMARLFPTVRFTTKNTADYIKDFGELKSIELTAQGTKKADNSVDQAASTLAYAADKSYTVIGTTVGFETGYAATTAPAAVKVTLTDGTWKDSDAVYMTVAPVDRKAFRTKSQKEQLKITYEFEHITFTLDAARKDAPAFESGLETSTDWTAVDANGNPNAVTPLPALDINNYNYLVTNNNTLIVLKGDFKDVFTTDGADVAWGAAAGGKVAVSTFSKIISNVALSDDEFKTIKKFAALTDLTLKENTSIPANTFTTAQAAAIKNLNLPKVTSIDDKFINNATAAAFVQLDSLAMPAYDFASAVVNKAFFNDDVKTTLKTLDMSGVASMMPTFGIERTMVFTGYAVLAKVAVKDNVIVAPSAFAGCVLLNTITGKLDITNASNAFDMMNTTANNVLKSVEVTTTVIPVDAFNNCTALETVKLNGSTIVPTAIGAKAFENTEVAYMDLSKATTIGASAFKGSAITSTNDKTTTLTVGAKELPASIFENCTNLKMVKFTDATKITGTDIFAGATAMVQIKFQKIFAFATGTYTNVFTATPGNIDFWTNPSQTGVDGSKLTLTPGGTFTFKSIQMKIED